MKHEAKFSVILPAGSFITSQTEAFEQAVQHYSIPAKLPLHADAKGNFVVSSGLCLRDAQLLRRQVSGCGFPADVVSDASEAAAAAAAATSKSAPAKAPVAPKAAPMKDLTSELGKVSVDSLNVDCDLPSDAWGSMELPSSLDLGLNDGEDLEKKSDWSGENWLSPDMSEHTLSVSAEVLLQKARESATDLIPPSAEKASAPKDESSKLILPEAPVKTEEKAQLSSAVGDSKPATPDIEAKKKADADKQSTQTASFSPPPEILLQAAAEQAQKKAEEAAKPAEVSKDLAPAEPAKETDKVEAEDHSAKKRHAVAANTDTQNSAQALASTSEKSFPANLVMCAMLVIVGISLILALISAFVSPISVLITPLF